MYVDLQVLFESVRQLTDASDEALVSEIVKVSKAVEGVRDVRNIRARGVGSGNLVGAFILFPFSFLSYFDSLRSGNELLR